MASDVDILSEDLNRLILEQFADKWTMLILRHFEGGKTVKFGDLKRNVPGISHKLLAQTLRKLERNGVLDHKVVNTTPVTVEYFTTTLGASLIAPITAMREWAERHLSEVQQARKRFDAKAKRAEGAARVERVEKSQAFR